MRSPIRLLSLASLVKFLTEARRPQAVYVFSCSFRTIWDAILGFLRHILLFVENCFEVEHSEKVADTILSVHLVDWDLVGEQAEPKLIHQTPLVNPIDVSRSTK
jgi:hypothetical protein